METKKLLGLGAIAVALYFILRPKGANAQTPPKCVLKEGLKWGSRYDKDIDDIYYYQNFQDLRTGIFYTRGIETKNPYSNESGEWSRRTDNKDAADASWCDDFLADGTLDPNCLINRRELEDLYISGSVC